MYMGKENVVRIYNGIYYSAIKMEMLPFATWMKPKGIMLRGISERQTLYDLTDMWNFKTQKQTKFELTVTENKLVAAGRGGTQRSKTS